MNSDRTATRSPLIIPVFIPHAGCPHHCVFCDQRKITATQPPLPTDRDIHDRIRAFLDTRRPDRRTAEVSFYGGNFLGLPPSSIHRLLTAAARWVDDGRIDGIRFSTRPDTVTPKRLEAIDRYPVRTVEIGVQSMNDAVLASSGRGHSARDALEAVQRSKARGRSVGVQLMIGLPGDDDDSAMSTTRQVVDMAPDFVRIYPTLVLSGSGLAEDFATGVYRPLALNEAVSLASRMYLEFVSNGIRVIRMGLQPTDELSLPGTVLAGPYHPSFGELVHQSCFLELAQWLLQNAAIPGRPVEEPVLRVHPRSESKLRGPGNRNLRKLEEKSGCKAIRIHIDPSIGPLALALGDGSAVPLTTPGGTS
ncbi:MAG: elongator complex protein 3 [Desulfobacterales bacterium]